MHLLDGARDTQMVGKPVFLSVSVKVFSEEISIWISRWGKGSSHQCRWLSLNLLRDWAEQIGGVRFNSHSVRHPSSPTADHPSLDAKIYNISPRFLGLWTCTGTYTISSLVLKALRLRLNITTNFSWFYNLQMADHTPCQSP